MGGGEVVRYPSRYGTARVRSAVLAAAVPPYLQKSADNPDGGLLVVHGDSDAVVPFEVSGKRAHETIAGSELVVIEGGPHGVNASHAEQFNRALLDFLAR